jgi:glycosyltransferase involved in cell wall biosynthesis
MRLAIIGTHGIPAKHGGFETFAAEISPMLAGNGIRVAVQCDVDSYHETSYKGVDLFFSSVGKSENPLRYYYEGIRWALKNSDIVLVASTGGSIFYFLNIFRRKLIITNPDGIEHRRPKWSFARKMYLRLSEMLAVRLSDYLIADSASIKNYLRDSYRNVERKISVIEYGAYQNRHTDNSILEKYSLEKDGYYLVVCRLEPENNLEMILDGFHNAMTVCPIVVIGNIQNTNFVKRIMSLYSSERIRFIGGVYDLNELSALRYSCKAYIHGHSVGGTNPSLLEAMGSHNIILAHDNEFNREVTAGNQLYFGSSEEFSEIIKKVELMTDEEKEKYKELSYNRISVKYNWDNILKKYLDFLRSVSV